VSKKTECDIHNWFWAEDDEYGCPVCEGAQVERERIIALLEEEASANDDVGNAWDAGYIRALIGLIKNDYENVIKDKDN